MFVDLDLGELLGGYPPEISERERRILVTQNPRYKKIYKEKLGEFIDTHDLLQRQRTVEENIRKANRITPNLHAELEAIDELLLMGSLEAERQCGRLNMAPWSPKLKEQQKVQRHWELWVRQLKTNRDYSAKKKSLAAKIAPNDPSQPTIKEAVELIREARQGYKEVVADAKQEWQEFLKERAGDHRLAGKISEAKIIDMIRNMEYKTKCFAHLRCIRGKNKNGGIQFITEPDPDDPEMDMAKKKWFGVFDQIEVHHKLGVRNLNHFRGGGAKSSFNTYYLHPKKQVVNTVCRLGPFFFFSVFCLVFCDMYFLRRCSLEPRKISSKLVFIM